MQRVPPLFSHQIGDIEFELANPRVLDTSDAGTGKTRTRLQVFAKRHSSGQAKCCLVLASKSLLRSAWESDAKKFTPWLAVSCCYAATREKDFKRKADIYVTNHDAVKWLAKQPPSFFDRFDSLIVDESTAFKHHTSQRSKALNKIKSYFKFRCLMTGTPDTNSVTDLWNQLFVLDDGQRLGRSFFHFRGQVQEPEQVGPRAEMVRWTDRPEAEAAVAGLISDITIRHTLDECHDIPQNHNYVVPFQLSPKHQGAYDQMAASKAADLETGQVTAINAAAVVTKLLQIASGAVYDDSGDYHLVANDRYEMIADLVQERKFCIVFFNWKHQKDLLIEEFNKRGITNTLIDGSVSSGKRDDAVKHYQAGFYKVLLAHPQSAAHGLTLTKGTSTIWASPTYNLEHWLQGNRRIYRAGQTQRTETVNVIAENTIEERVYRVLSTKDAKMANLLEFLR